MCRQCVYRESFETAEITVIDRVFDLNGEAVSAAFAGRALAQRHEEATARDARNEAATVARANAAHRRNVVRALGRNGG
ncbi:MAG: hypothetical protein QM811_21840 [Pirellulales bacterium]